MARREHSCAVAGDENPELKPPFFGKEQESIVDAMDRMIKAGGKLESGGDLVERATTLNKYAEQRDLDFDYAITSSSPAAPQPEWPELPYLTMQIISPDAKVDMAAWPAEGAEVQLPSFGFHNNEAGAEARAQAVQAWARGEEVAITKGAHVRFHVPAVLRDLLPELGQMDGARLRIPPTAPFDAVLELETEQETVSHAFQVRVVPPPPGEFGALAGYIGETLIQIAFSLPDDGHAQAQFSVSAHFGSEARANVEAARLLHAWCTHKQVTFRGEKLYPEGISGQAAAGPGDDLRDEMEWRSRFYADVVFLEDRLGADIPLPEQMTPEDMNALGTAAEVLRTGEGTATFRNVTGVVSNPAEIPGLPDRFAKEGTHRKMVTFPAFGQELELGEGDYELPPLKIVDIIPHGTTPNAPAKVVLGAVDDHQMRFRLVKWEPPGESES